MQETLASGERRTVHFSENQTRGKPVLPLTALALGTWGADPEIWPHPCSLAPPIRSVPCIWKQAVAHRALLQCCFRLISMVSYNTFV